MFNVVSANKMHLTDSITKSLKQLVIYIHHLIMRCALFSLNITIKC